MKNIIEHSQAPELFRQDAHQIVEMLAGQLEKSQSDSTSSAISWSTPEEQLSYWQKDFYSPEPTDLLSLAGKVLDKATNFHSRKYMAHQVSSPLPLTALTSALIGYMNNATTVYELGMAGNAMERVVIEYLAKKFGYDIKSTGLVTSGGSLGNLTALLTARASFMRQFKGNENYHKLAVMVSAEAHYSIERAVKIMGLPAENVLKIPVDENYRVRTDLLETIYEKALSEGKMVFCIVGCACSTATGSYDDLESIGSFAQKHNIWFHADGAHGGPVIFSAKYRHLVKGIEKSDSLVLDFHKMMLVPSLSTAVIFNSRNGEPGAFSPKAEYLWHDQQADEWYNSAKHTIECTKPMTILHTYAIMRLYGDSMYRQHIDTLYDLGLQFAEMIEKQPNMELAVKPESNIVCFRYLSADQDNDELNKQILDILLREGRFYIVSTTLRGRFYLRVSLMNPMTSAKDLEELIANILAIVKKLK